MGLHEGVGNCLKYLKSGGGQKRGEEKTKILKRGSKLGQGVGALKGKGGGGWNPLRTMVGFQKGKCIGSSRLAVSSGAVDVYDIFVIC